MNQHAHLDNSLKRFGPVRFDLVHLGSSTLHAQQFRSPPTRYLAAHWQGHSSTWDLKALRIDPTSGDR